MIEAQADIALARALGGGLVAAVDGLRFVVPMRSVDARPNRKYFGRRKGATWLNMISDQGVGLAGKVVSGTPRDSLHLIDLIYRQDAGRRPEVIISDTGAYSDIVFGLMRLLGFDYTPYATRTSPAYHCTCAVTSTSTATTPSSSPSSPGPGEL